MSPRPSSQLGKVPGVHRGNRTLVAVGFGPTGRGAGDKLGAPPAVASLPSTAAARRTATSRRLAAVRHGRRLSPRPRPVGHWPSAVASLPSTAAARRTAASEERQRAGGDRERFAELNAKLRWEENKERIQAQYL
ncbi:hypothetical protein E2562_005747 [Oryza meyeriana var. granulata]|uniref:Uncharacterized protein n=1 Tax=Oryza meyeriana var. granulata TaxID=110450 RepID=A0A6G1F4L8_9ORYZ|nr:hypothetical protein E2562_005747 [Oryza meyeriana var. granulata]